MFIMKSKSHETDKEVSVKQETNVQYGKGATMPVMAADKYATVNLPNLRMFEPLDEEKELDLS